MVHVLKALTGLQSGSSQLPTHCFSAVKTREREKLLNCANKLFFLKFLAISFFFFFLLFTFFALSHITVKSPPRCFRELALAHLCPLPPPSCTQVASTN